MKWRAKACFLWGKRVGIIQPGEEKAPHRPYSSLSVLEGGLLERWVQILQQGCCSRARSNGFKLQEADSEQNIKKKIFTMAQVA